MSDDHEPTDIPVTDIKEYRAKRIGVGIVTVRGRDYPYKIVPGCQTCNNPHRTYIETQVLAGHSMKSVARDLEGMELGQMPHPNSTAISFHMKNHMPTKQAALQALIEERAKEVGKSIEESTTTLVDGYVVAKTVLQIGFERIVAGEVDPEISDMLAAARMIQDIEDRQGAGGLDQQMWVDALSAFFEVTQEIMPPELWQQWRQGLDTNSVLVAIKEKREREGTIPGVALRSS